MKYLLAAAALLAIIFASVAIIRYAHGAECSVIDKLVLAQAVPDIPDSSRPPPAQYLHPFAGTVVERTARDMAEMAELCYPHPRAYRVMGCRFGYVDRSY